MLYHNLHKDLCRSVAPLVVMLCRELLVCVLVLYMLCVFQSLVYLSYYLYIEDSLDQSVLPLPGQPAFT